MNQSEALRVGGETPYCSLTTLLMSNKIGIFKKAGWWVKADWQRQSFVGLVPSWAVNEGVSQFAITLCDFTPLPGIQLEAHTVMRNLSFANHVFCRLPRAL